MAMKPLVLPVQESKSEKSNQTSAVLGGSTSSSSTSASPHAQTANSPTLSPAAQTSPPPIPQAIALTLPTPLHSHRENDPDAGLAITPVDAAVTGPMAESSAGAVSDTNSSAVNSSEQSDGNNNSNSLQLSASSALASDVSTAALGSSAAGVSVGVGVVDVDNGVASAPSVGVSGVSGVDSLASRLQIALSASESKRSKMKVLLERAGKHIEEYKKKVNEARMSALKAERDNEDKYSARFAAMNKEWKELLNDERANHQKSKQQLDSLNAQINALRMAQAALLASRREDAMEANSLRETNHTLSSRLAELHDNMKMTEENHSQQRNSLQQDLQDMLKKQHSLADELRRTQDRETKLREQVEILTTEVSQLKRAVLHAEQQQAAAEVIAAEARSHKQNDRATAPQPLANDGGTHKIEEELRANDSFHQQHDGSQENEKIQNQPEQTVPAPAMPTPTVHTSSAAFYRLNNNASAASGEFAAPATATSNVAGSFPLSILSTLHEDDPIQSADHARPNSISHFHRQPQSHANTQLTSTVRELRQTHSHMHANAQASLLELAMSDNANDGHQTVFDFDMTNTADRSISDVSSADGGISVVDGAASGFSSSSSSAADLSSFRLHIRGLQRRVMEKDAENLDLHRQLSELNERMQELRTHHNMLETLTQTRTHARKETPNTMDERTANSFTGQHNTQQEVQQPQYQPNWQSTNSTGQTSSTHGVMDAAAAAHGSPNELSTVSGNGHASAYAHSQNDGGGGAGDDDVGNTIGGISTVNVRYLRNVLLRYFESDDFDSLFPVLCMLLNVSMHERNAILDKRKALTNTTRTLNTTTASAAASAGKWFGFL